MDILNESDKVWVQIEVTVQPEQFEPIKIVQGQSRTIGPEEDPDVLRKDLLQRLLIDGITEAERVRTRPDDLYAATLSRELVPAPRELVGRARRFTRPTVLSTDDDIPF